MPRAIVVDERPKIVECKDCTKSGRNHIEHVREHMIEVYGSDNCLRKDCTEQVTHKSGYCTTHHTEWIHGENAHHLQATYTDYKK